MNHSITSTAQGSLQQVSTSTGKPLANVFAQNVKAVVLVDRSGSMAEGVNGYERSGKSKIEIAREELNKLQLQMPGELAIYQFDSSCEPIPHGILGHPAGGTDVANALDTVNCFDLEDMQIIIATDGLPDDAEQAYKSAEAYKHAKISAIYIGPEDDTQARTFLRKLCSMHGGKAIMPQDGVKLLGAGVKKLLGSAK